MKVYKWMPIAGMLIVTMDAANAQQRLTDSKMRTGGNHMSQTSQPLPESSAISPSGQHDVHYQVVPIGVLPGKTVSFLSIVRAVNNREHVTGYSYVYDGDIALTGQGFIWQDGKIEALPLLKGWPGAFAFGINDRDQVVGAANNVDADGNLIQTAVLWDHERPINLGALHPGWTSDALDVSTLGVVVGASGSVGTNFPTPVVWYGGDIHALPQLPGEEGGWAEEINALGVIVGWQESATNQIPCLWYWNGAGYTAVDLGSLGGDVGQAFGINNFNKVVGYSLHSGNIHGPAFLWDYRQGLKALPLLPPDTDGLAYNINDLGQIVGESQTFDDNGQFVSQRSAIWEDGTVTALQTLVPANTPPLTYETSNINDRGDTAVNATNPDGSPLALLLVPKQKKDR